MNAWCLSRNYLKVPEVLLESFGFKGLSCPKTGEFDYNPLQIRTIDAMPGPKRGAFTIPLKQMGFWHSKNSDLTVDGQIS